MFQSWETEELMLPYYSHLIFSTGCTTKLRPEITPLALTPPFSAGRRRWALKTHFLETFTGSQLSQCFIFLNYVTTSTRVQLVQQWMWKLKPQSQSGVMDEQRRDFAGKGKMCDTYLKTITLGEYHSWGRWLRLQSTFEFYFSSPHGYNHSKTAVSVSTGFCALLDLQILTTPICKELPGHTSGS